MLALAMGGRTVTKRLQQVALIKTNGKLVISGTDGTAIPFQFDMRFTWAAENDKGVVFDPGG